MSDQKLHNAKKPIIDFTELSHGVAKGEKLQQLARFMARKLKLEESWSGRGPDDGKDLIFVEEIRGALTSRRVKWLVSCKDNATSGKSVQEADVGAVLEKVIQHHASGFLLVTTTTASSGLKKMLDALDTRNGGKIETMVWDDAEIAAILLKDEMKEIFMQFLPNSFKRFTGTAAEALDQLKETLPKFVYDKMIQSVSPYMNVGLDFSGEDVAPNDNSAARSIDQMLEALFEKEDLSKAIRIAESMESDMFISFVSRFDQFDYGGCHEFLIEVIRSAGHTDTVLNAYQYLSEGHELNNSLRLDLASYLDSYSIELMLSDEISEWIGDELMANLSEYDCWADIDELSTHTSVEVIDVEYLSILAPKGESIEFDGDLSFNLNLRLGSQGDSVDSAISLPGKFRGIFDFDAMCYVLDEVSIDTTRYYE